MEEFFMSLIFRCSTSTEKMGPLKAIATTKVCSTDRALVPEAMDPPPPDSPSSRRIHKRRACKALNGLKQNTYYNVEDVTHIELVFDMYSIYIIYIIHYTIYTIYILYVCVSTSFSNYGWPKLIQRRTSASRLSILLQAEGRASQLFPTWGMTL